MSCFFRRVVVHFGCKKIDVLVKRRREGQFLGESEQGIIPEGKRDSLLDHGFETLM